MNEVKPYANVNADMLQTWPMMVASCWLICLCVEFLLLAEQGAEKNRIIAYY
jgi:hypothetical protein